jgi:hypothetical protein
MLTRNMLSYAFVALVVFESGTAAAQDLQPLYVPFVKAEIEGFVLQPDGNSVTNGGWLSTMSVFNPTDSPASVINVAAYGKGAVLNHPSSPPIQPHQGQNHGASLSSFPDRGVGFLEVQTSPGIVFYADVQRVTYHCAVHEPLCDAVVHGQVNIPVYRSLFPAGSVAVSGAAELGYFHHVTPVDENHKTIRRVNVTLFNAGDAPATFVVRTSPVNGSLAPLTEQSIVVEAKDVVQINRFPVPTDSSTPMQSVNGGSRIWVTTTADQPFLSYVSTVFDGVDSLDLPFQVYPSYLQN